MKAAAKPIVRPNSSPENTMPEPLGVGLLVLVEFDAPVEDRLLAICINTAVLFADSCKTCWKKRLELMV